MTIPLSPTALRVLTILLAPVQWLTALWYVNRFGKHPTRRLQRIVPWMFMFVVCVGIPFAIYLSNHRLTSPDHVLEIVGPLEAILVGALMLVSLYRLRNSK